jgi:hypothetical protein
MPSEYLSNNDTSVLDVSTIKKQIVPEIKVLRDRPWLEPNQRRRNIWQNEGGHFSRVLNRYFATVPSNDHQVQEVVLAFEEIAKDSY